MRVDANVERSLSNFFLKLSFDNEPVIKIFLFGVVLITFTEVSSKYAGINLKINFLLAFSPILLSAIILFYIIKKLKFKND